MHSGPSLARGKLGSFHPLPPSPLPHGDNFMRMRCFPRIFLTHYSPRTLALLMATISHPCNHSIGGHFIILFIQKHQTF